MFRLSPFKDYENISKLGDRDMCVWAHAFNGNYYPATYSYSDLNGAGNKNIYTAIPYGYQ